MKSTVNGSQPVTLLAVKLAVGATGVKETSIVSVSVIVPHSFVAVKLTV